MKPWTEGMPWAYHQNSCYRAAHRPPRHQTEIASSESCPMRLRGKAKGWVIDCRVTQLMGGGGEGGKAITKTDPTFGRRSWVESPSFQRNWKQTLDTLLDEVRPSLDRFAMWFPKKNRSGLIPVTVCEIGSLYTHTNQTMFAILRREYDSDE